MLAMGDGHAGAGEGGAAGDRTGDAVTLKRPSDRKRAGIGRFGELAGDLVEEGAAD